MPDKKPTMPDKKPTPAAPTPEPEAPPIAPPPIAPPPIAPPRSVPTAFMDMSADMQTVALSAYDAARAGNPATIPPQKPMLHNDAVAQAFHAVRHWCRANNRRFPA
jgi:hypothetical protein